MSLITVKCQSCGASLRANVGSRYCICEYCETQTLLPSVLKAQTQPKPAAVVAKEQQKDVLEWGIDELDTSVRLCNILRRAQIKKVGDLLRYSHNDLMELRNMTDSLLDELMAILEGLGKTLKEE